MINYDKFRQWESGKFNGRISKYLANSLTEITLWKFKSYHFKHFIGPLNKVRSLKIIDSLIGANVTDLPGLFPSLRKIKFDYNERKYLHPSVYEQHFAHLEEVIESSFESDARHIERIFQLNPQLKKISIAKVEWDFFKTLSEMLPQLESMDIRVLSAKTFVDGSEIRFDNLKSLTLWSLRYFPDNVPIIPLKFSEKFVELNDWTLRGRLLNFISQNKQLKILFTQNMEFQRIAEELPELEVFRTDMSVYGKADIDKVVAFLGAAKNLKRIEIKDCSSSSLTGILQNVSGDWEQTERTMDFRTVLIRSE